MAPQGYRTTLTLQLHAAAILTDSGGVQREAGLARGARASSCVTARSGSRPSAESEGRMVTVGLDVALARRELERLADPRDAPALATTRAQTLDVRPAGAADAICAALVASTA